MAAPTRWCKLKSANKPNKQAQNSKTHKSQWVRFNNFSLKNQLLLMFASERIKAFITDMFMINMPILYLTTYVFLDGKDAFTHNQNVIFVCGISYGVILSLFFAFSAQTPGYRYMRLKLVRYNSQDSQSLDSQNKTQSINTLESAQNANTESKGEKVGFVRSFVRYGLWVFGTSFLFGILLGLFRKDGRCLHDVLCNTQVISVK